MAIAERFWAMFPGSWPHPEKISQTRLADASDLGGGGRYANLIASENQIWGISV